MGPNTEADTDEAIHRHLQQQKEVPRTAYELAAVLRSKSLHIGACGIRINSTENREANFGYVLRRDYWGQGFATEAAKAIVDFGFKQLGMHRIWATAAPANIASQRVLSKIGMKREGYLRENMFVRGSWRGSCLFSILEQDWRPHAFHELE